MTAKFEVNTPMPSGTKPPPRMTLHSQWVFGDRVEIDGTDVIGVVTAICWRSQDGMTIEVSWMHNGTAQTAWIQPYRLKEAER